MDPGKIEIIIKWEALKTVKGVQKKLGFANFYRKFIKKKFQAGNAFNEFNEKKTRNSIGQKQRTIFFSKLKQIFVTVFY